MGMKKGKGLREGKTSLREPFIDTEIKAEQFTKSTIVDTILNSINDIIAIQRPDHTIICYNQAGYDFLGMTQDEVHGRKCFELIGRQGPCEECATTMARETKRPERIEMYIPERDIYLDCCSNPVLDNDGNITFIIERLTDITRQKKVEEALHRSEKKYRSIFENSVVGKFQSTPEGGHISANSAYAKMFGYSSPEELMAEVTDIGDHFYADPEDRSKFKEMIARQGMVQRLEFEALKKDRTPIWACLSARAVKDENGSGSVLYYEGTIEDITPFKEAEQALRMEEARMRTITGSARDAIVMMDPEGNISFWNPAAEHIFGYNRDEVIGLNLHLLLAPEHNHKAYREGFGWFRETGKGNVVGRTLELEARRKDGREISVELSLSALELKDGWHAVGIIRDITNRKKAEDALKESEQKYRSIFENSVVGIFQTTPEGGLLSINPYLAKLYGFESPQDMIGQITDIGRQHYANPEDREIFKRTLESEGSITDFETKVLKRDGTSVWIAVSALAVKDDTGSVVRYEGTLVDITDRKKAEEEVIRERSKLKTLSDNAPFGLVLIDGKGRFTYMNDRFTTLFGYGPDDIPDGRTWFRKAYPDTEYRRTVIATWVEDMREALPGEKTPRVFTVTCADDTQRIVSFIPSVLVSGDYLMTCEDMTELKRLESQLLQSQKMEAVGTLAGGIAHDFNNILTALMGYASLMQMKMDRDSPLMPYVEQVLKASEKAADLTRGLLTFSRQQPVTLSPLDMNDAISGTKKLLKRLLTEDIDLATSLTTEDTAVMADRSQMDQVLFNLAANARDAMPRGGTLTVSTSVAEIDGPFIDAQGFGSPGRYVVVTVSDTGLGMDEATKARIFDPFFTTKEVGKGTGLGLATVYGIIDQHGGHITVESEPGRGTSFSIYLPAVNTGTGEEGNIQVPVRGGRETVLVAEDNKEVRRFIREALSQHGYVTVEASDGQDAVEKFRHHGGIDLVIIDSVMPKKNGREAYEEMRAMDPRVRAIFISGHTRDVVLEKGIGEGEFDFIAKPLSPAVLLRKVREVLER